MQSAAWLKALPVAARSQNALKTLRSVPRAVSLKDRQPAAKKAPKNAPSVTWLKAPPAVVN